VRNASEATGAKPIAVRSQSISGVSTVNPLVALYDIHGRKREVPFFGFVLDTTRDDFFSSQYFSYLAHFGEIRSEMPMVGTDNSMTG
jgi:hypothetical protein